jgi:hypothetical protein
MSTTGGMTNPTGKICPDQLCPWSNFLDIQKDIVETVFGLYPKTNLPRVFNSRLGIKEMAGDLHMQKIDGEKDLDIYLRSYTKLPWPR